MRVAAAAGLRCVGRRLRIRWLGDDRFVPLSHSHVNDPQVTVYVKGFLSANDSASDWTAFLASHRRIAGRGALAWGPRVAGYRWASSALTVPLVPVTPLVHTALALYNKTRIFRLNPASAAIYVATELALSAAQLWYNYRECLDFIASHAHIMAHKLERLGTAHAHVRIVAHSMGCALVLAALRHVRPEHWPRGELHLLAPAVIEADFADVFLRMQHLGHPLCVYHSPNDLVLRYLFALYGDPLGLEGSPVLRCKDVSDALGWLVHNAYAPNWSEFAEDLRHK